MSNPDSEFIEFYLDFVERFDGTEYQQGKKDGMRIAIAFLGINVPLPTDAFTDLTEIMRRRLKRSEQNVEHDTKVIGSE